MGQKVNPHGLRVGVIKDWDSRWFARDDAFGDTLVEDYNLRKFLKKTLFEAVNEDYRIREFLNKKLKAASVPRIFIERAGQRIRVKIYTARPGVVIGQKGSALETLKADLAKFLGKDVLVDIQEIKKPDLVAESVALQLERRVSFRRAIKKAISSCMSAGADGVKLQVSGRLGGAEIARTEWQRKGRIPLHTLRENIDYGFTEANTVYGKIGVKCWLCLKSEDNI